MKHLYLSLLLLLPLWASAQTSISIGNDELKLKFDGRVTFDGALYLPGTDTEGIKWGTTEAEDFRFSNGIQLTQLRLGFLASIGERWQAKFDVTLNDRRVTPTDIFLVYRIDPQSRVLMGYYKDPLSMEANTPSKFLNLSTPMAVSMLTHDQRYIGATYIRTGQHYYLAAGIYSGTSSPVMTEANRGNDGYGLSARLAWVPTHNERTTLHIGASGRFRHVADYATRLTLSTLPESRIDFRRFVQGSIDRVRHYWATGVELALRHDKLFVTAEWLGNFVHHDVAVYANDGGYGIPATQLGWRGESTFADGWTLTASYMLRGKQRAYIKSEGFFNPAGNVGRGGSLELIGRLGQVNLDRLGKSVGQAGGKGTAYMLGLNWYPNANILFGLNYTYLDHNREATAGGMLSLSPAADRFGLDFHTLQLRAQFLF